MERFRRGVRRRIVECAEELFCDSDPEEDKLDEAFMKRRNSWKFLRETYVPVCDLHSFLYPRAYLDASVQPTLQDFDLQWAEDVTLIIRKRIARKRFHKHYSEVDLAQSMLGRACSRSLLVANQNTALKHAAMKFHKKRPIQDIERKTQSVNSIKRLLERQVTLPRKRFSKETFAAVVASKLRLIENDTSSIAFPRLLVGQQLAALQSFKQILLTSCISCSVSGKPMGTCGGSAEELQPRGLDALLEHVNHKHLGKFYWSKDWTIKGRAFGINDGFTGRVKWLGWFCNGRKDTCFRILDSSMASSPDVDSKGSG